MIQEVRDRVLAILGENFSTEQLQMIDCAVRDALRGMRVEKEDMLPAVVQPGIDREIEEYKRRKETKGLKKETVANYVQVLRAFNAVTGKAAQDIVDVDIIDFLNKYQTYRNISASRKKDMRIILNGFFGYLSDSGRILRNPMATVEQIKVPKKHRRALTMLGYEHVRLACKDTRERALIEFLFSTGCRVSEVVSLNRSDIDYYNKRILVKGKGDKERYVFLNAPAIVWLDRYFQERSDTNEALFVSSKAPHGRLLKGALEKNIHQLGERCSKHLFPHLFRHTMATYCLNMKMDVQDLKMIMGHESIETTMLYVTQNPEHARQAYFQVQAA